MQAPFVPQQESVASARRDLLAVLVALMALLAWDRAGLDLSITHLYGDAQGFAWRNHWFTAGLMHGGVRTGAWAVFALLLIGVWRPLPFARRLNRRERLWWLLTTAGCLLLIPAVKAGSHTSCPWSLAEFGGGLAHYVPHWDLGRFDGGPGGCFPSGHAATAFGFVAGWFALRRSAPRAAAAWLAFTVLAGLAFSWVQVARGAHYASHCLWTAWICWAAAALSFHAARRWLEPDPADEPGAWPLSVAAADTRPAPR